MESGLSTEIVLRFGTVLLVLEAKLIIRFGLVLHRLKTDFWLSFCMTKGKISAFASAALFLGLSFPFQQMRCGWLASCLEDT